MTLDLEDEYGLDLGFDYEKTATDAESIRYWRRKAALMRHR